MPRKRNTAPASGRTVLVVDDTTEYLMTIQRLIARDGHEVLTAASGKEALETLRSRRVDLALVDYFMPGMTGEELIAELRTFDDNVQVILQTGYASERPPREMLRRLEIQGYHDKGEGPEKLLLWVDVGLKAAHAHQLMERSRQGLRFILNATPELHRVQPLDDLLQGVLLQATGLLGAVDAFLADLPRHVHRGDIEAFLAMQHEGEAAGLRVRAATGRFADAGATVPSALMEGVTQALAGGAMVTVEGGTMAPLRVGETTIGALYLDRTVNPGRDIELLEVFANQAAVAIQNITLFEMAALDELTGTYTRRFFEQALRREIRLASRNGAPLSLLMVDLNEMKRINDTGGHLCGDNALRAAGKLLRTLTRATDIVGRFGGDEFAVVLPASGEEGAKIVEERLAAGFEGLSVVSQGRSFPVRASIGASWLDPSTDGSAGADADATMMQLLQRADAALYRHKREGRARPTRAEARVGGGQRNKESHA